MPYLVRSIIWRENGKTALFDYQYYTWYTITTTIQQEARNVSSRCVSLPGNVLRVRVWTSVRALKVVRVVNGSAHIQKRQLLLSCVWHLLLFAVKETTFKVGLLIPVVLVSASHTAAVSSKWRNIPSTRGCIYDTSVYIYILLILVPWYLLRVRTTTTKGRYDTWCDSYRVHV